MLLNYAWPGNVRELENVVKRFVILQDENLVLAELQRVPAVDGNVRAAAASPPAPAVMAVPPAPVAPAAGAGDAAGRFDPGAGTAARRRRRPRLRLRQPPPFELAEGAKLPALARQAALIAEREAISQALDRFRWNRRKAAKLLGVSYKTLLNKMKECGIRE